MQNDRLKQVQDLLQDANFGAILNNKNSDWALNKLMKRFNKIKKGATSDFMEIERQRGISVATSVLAFNYQNKKINILDTPGHKDFAEDTFRTLTAVDSVIVVIDVAKGVEEQTEKLVEVCRMRKIPMIVFINKLDREGKDAFDLNFNRAIIKLTSPYPYFLKRKD